MTKLQAHGGPAVKVADFMRSPTPSGLYELCQGGQKIEQKRHLPNEVTKAMQKHQEITSGINLNVRAFWRYIVFTGNTSRVLLTGATGYVGAHLLKELLEKTECQVFCLIRVSARSGNAEEVAYERLLETLSEHGIESSVLKQRVTVLPGDVSVVNMGLGQDDFLFLQQLIDVVIHSAALVNLVYPYQLLESINVQGTTNVINFARSGTVKALHYISTNGILPEVGQTECFAESDNPSHHMIESGYGEGSSYLVTGDDDLSDRPDQMGCGADCFEGSGDGLAWCDLPPRECWWTVEWRLE